VSAGDEMEIRTLVARYADAVCRRDAQAWAATWAEDCLWDLGGGRVTHGRQQGLDLWMAALAKYPWVAQLPTGGIVQVSEDRAVGTWYVLELNHLPDGAGALHLGHYQDEYVRTEHGWLFAARRFHLIYRGGLDPGVVVPLPTAPGFP
jgi:uncharacterized protein (TIGR02246 family)